MHEWGSENVEEEEEEEEEEEWSGLAQEAGGELD